MVVHGELEFFWKITGEIPQFLKQYFLSDNAVVKMYLRSETHFEPYDVIRTQTFRLLKMTETPKSSKK